MKSNEKPAILLVGRDTTLHYLFNRFAEQSGYQLAGNREHVSVEEIEAVKPAAILFLSTELLAKNQRLVADLASHESPIIVCSSTAEEARARELGADYCLLHPLTFNDFQTALEMISISKRI
jgi:CheY-like chemotaxis protein